MIFFEIDSDHLCWAWCITTSKTELFKVNLEYPIRSYPTILLPIWAGSEVVHHQYQYGKQYRTQRKANGAFTLHIFCIGSISHWIRYLRTINRNIWRPEISRVLPRYCSPGYRICGRIHHKRATGCKLKYFALEPLQTRLQMTGPKIRFRHLFSGNIWLIDRSLGFPGDITKLVPGHREKSTTLLVGVDTGRTIYLRMLVILGNLNCR